MSRGRFDDTIIIENVPLITDSVVANVTHSTRPASSSAESRKRTVSVIAELCTMFGPIRACSVFHTTMASRDDTRDDQTMAVECSFVDVLDAAAAVDNLQGVVLGGKILSCRYKPAA